LVAADAAYSVRRGAIVIILRQFWYYRRLRFPLRLAWRFALKTLGHAPHQRRR
jgi:hypothetical protein